MKVTRGHRRRAARRRGGRQEPPALAALSMGERAGPEGGPRACYVYLHNILADPDRLPRYLLKYVVSRLSQGGRGPLYQTPLFGFLDRAIRHALRLAGVRGQARRQSQGGCWRRTGAYFEEVARRSGPPTRSCSSSTATPDPSGPTIRAAKRLASEALAWLSGDEIDPRDRPLVRPEGRRRTTPAMIRDDQEAEQVLPGPRPAGAREPTTADPLHRPGRQPRPGQAQAARAVPPRAAGSRLQPAGDHFRREANAAGLPRGGCHPGGGVGPHRPVQGRAESRLTGRRPQDPRGAARAVPRAVPRSGRGAPPAP